MITTLGIIASSKRKAFQDLFNRTTSGSLGSPWVATKGTWYANGSQAQCDDAASNYSIASVVGGGPNATTSAAVSGGTGVSFWITDANNWWAVIAYATSSTSTYTYSCTTTCTSTTTTCNTCTYDCNPYTCTVCDVYCGSPVHCCSSTTTTCYNSCTGANCSVCGSTTSTTTSPCTGTCTGTTTTINNYMQILQSSGGTVSTIATIGLSAAPASIKVVSLGSTFTAYALDGSGATLASSAQSPTSPTVTSNIGIIKAPTSYGQGSVVDNFATAI